MFKKIIAWMLEEPNHLILQFDEVPTEPITSESGSEKPFVAAFNEALSQRKISIPEGITIVEYTVFEIVDRTSEPIYEVRRTFPN